MALRAVVGGRELDQFLAHDKDVVARNWKRPSGSAWLRVWRSSRWVSAVPGDMKELMNKVTRLKSRRGEPIVRREETAAMRSQATPPRLEGNPTLMRLRELEVLEKVATSAS